MNREEAIEVYNGLINTKIKEAFEFFAPELRESEDERIRKFLIDILSSGVWKTEWPFSPVDCVAYLEKLKEQKPVQSDVEKEYVRIIKSIVSDFIRDKKPKDTLLYQDIFDWLEGRHVEQKPAEWGEEDENMLWNIISIVGECKSIQADEMLVWLKSLRPRRVNVSDQTLQLLICYLYGCHDVAKRDGEKADCRRYISYLEDLDYTLKNRWKPSEEQMKALQSAIVFKEIRKASDDDITPLKSLYEQLKAL